MRKVTPIKFSFVYLNTDKSKSRLADAYRRIFTKAWKNLLDKQSTQKYTDNNYDKSTTERRIPNDRRVGQDTQSHKSDTLPHGAQGQDSSNKVRQVVEGKFSLS